MKSWPIVLYLVTYAALLAAMNLQDGFGLGEPLGVVLLFGIGLSLLALWTTRRVKPRDITVKDPRRESAALAGYLVVFVVFITWGLPGVRITSTHPVLQIAVVTTAKLLIAVVTPFAIWRATWRYRVRDFVDLRSGMSGHWRAFIVLSIALLVLQALFGRARADLTPLHPGGFELLVAVAFTGVWLVIEVGVVEEFFFRGLVQARVAALMNSDLAGLVVMALIFGLAHAPGFYLRPAVTGEALGPRPGILMAVGYSIVITSATGFFLGVLWIRTRNLLALALVHAAGDLLPSLAETVRLWRRLTTG